MDDGEVDTFVDKGRLSRSFPMVTGELCVRVWERDDVDRLATWPAYPFPFERFDLGYRSTTPGERYRLFERFCAYPDRLLLIGDVGTTQTVMFASLNMINGEKRTIGNMGYRIHPSWCDQGIGTRFIRIIADTCFASGVESFRFDVAASNPRAVRCYEKAGFAIVEEFWRNDDFLQTIDPDAPAYEFLRPHARRVKDLWELRFYWMERHA